MGVKKVLLPLCVITVSHCVMRFCTVQAKSLQYLPLDMVQLAQTIDTHFLSTH